MKLRYHVISAMLLCGFQFSFAQTIPTDTTKHTLSEVIISVNRAEETKKTVAQQVDVLTSEDIANTQSQTSADVMSNTGNVFVQKSQLGGGSPVIRGFEASRILLEVDGVRMNNIIYRGGHLQNIVTIDNNILDRTEILYGPASTIYGSAALGGVIHFYTKNPMFAEKDSAKNIRVNAMTRYGSSDNEFTGHVDFNIGMEKFASLTSITYAKFGDLRGGENQNPFYTGAYGERPYYVKRINGKDSLVKNADRYLQVQTGYSQYDILQKFAYKQNEHATHGLNIQFSNSSDVPRYDRLTDPGSTGLKNAEWYYGPQTRMLAAYDLNVKNAEAKFQNIHFGVNYQAITESRHDRKFNNDNLHNRIENVGVIGSNLEFQKSTLKHNIRFGFDAQYNMLTSTANSENIVTGVVSPLDTRYPDGDNTMLDAALYFSHTFMINDQLTLVDGIRFGIITLHSTFVDTSFFHLPYKAADQSNPVYSGSVGLIHSPSDDLKLSLMVSTGFRAPTVDDLSKVFESGPGMLIVPNKDLKPEQTINYELGVTKIFNRKTSWENYLYYTQFQNAIVTDKFQYEGKDSILYDGSMSAVYANQNKGEAFIYGFSSNFRTKLSDNFSMSLVVNYTYGRILTDSSNAPLDHIPPVMSRLQLTYSNNKFSSDFFINYNGAKKLKDYYLNGEDNEQYATPMGMPAWLTANLHFSYKACKLLTVQAGIDNIFDTQYRYFASGMNAPGRNIYAAIRFHY